MFQSFLLECRIFQVVSCLGFAQTTSPRLVAETLAIVGKIDWFAGESLWHMYNLLLGWFLFSAEKKIVLGYENW